MNMHKNTKVSVVLPIYNEEVTIEQALIHLYHQKQQTNHSLLERTLYEIIIVDNNSTDTSLDKIHSFSQQYPDLQLVIIQETNQGVAWARKAGMDNAVLRSRQRDEALNIQDSEHFIFSSDADCYVHPYWLDSMLSTLLRTSCLTVSRYVYPEAHFATRPRLWGVIKRILKARDHVMRIFGGFPDGKGFAIPRSIYERVNGIDIFYQLRDGQFVCHLSDDWDFGIKVRANNESIEYVPDSVVLTNSRRIDHGLQEMIAGVAYGQNGIICMQDIRPTKDVSQEDITETEANMLYEYSIKDFTTKHILLPILLTPTFLQQQAVMDFLSPQLCQKLGNRIKEIKDQMRVLDFTPIHTYKTPCYRLFLEFRNELFARMRLQIDPAIGYPPPLPHCLELVRQNQRFNFNDFIYYYCEDRESGEAHNYFGNGGVF